ncbi:hypothetical protein CROQUDRAFT_657950 [Cronartium quercuum f. sp. fusiforme G11]|uniref:Queuosine 5'-phosphate N-glycosylase/hydrolase n=1 Tax=Cronartium quercuum f. sp. fusiforme G11 TaxID=708437 RepID=A0A9P6NKV4_9BASI|nr:hypothetical protein CROQUDRAFT_657950 [Cronartium quercuum f. sp. fusiforme G11]
MASTLTDRLPIPSPPPQPTTIIEAVRQSCEQVRNRYNIQLKETECDRFLLSLNRDQYQKLYVDRTNGQRFPLQFSSSLDELNVVCLLGLLNCLHEHRDFLKEKTGRGAWETVRYLVLGAYLSSSGDSSSSILTTAGMLRATPSSIASLISLPLHIERPMATGSPIMIGEPDPIATQIVNQIVHLLHSTAAILQRDSYPDLGSFIASQGLNDRDGDRLLRVLLNAFEGFRDMYILDDQPVYILKKALFLLESICTTFNKKTKSNKIPIPNLNSPLPILADNVIPTMLLHFGLIDLTNSQDSEISKIDLKSSSGLELSPRAATILRASSLACCQQIIQRAHQLAINEAWLSELTEVGLDSYLWNIAKETPELRELKRLRELGTMMY